jgi:cellulose synthase/poly-beta-1,6-N-acetylglucosamine synthase-like glycosyltransferase
LGFWYWFFVGPALLLTLLSLRGERKRAAYVARRLAEKSEHLPPATVIVPVKGQDTGLRENLAALASQDYPDYELIVTAHSAADIPPGVLPPKVRVVLAHGTEPNTGEKVQNLQAAVGAARKFSAVFAFADSDGRVTDRWLRSLAGPLSEKGVGAVTGYRWYAPTPATFWSLMRGLWDAVALSRLGPGNCSFAWGGAMAIRRETFYDLDVLSHWKNTISDDYALSAAVRNSGLTIAFAPGAMVPSLEPTTLRRLFEWTRRQMTITRVYNGRLWSLALIAHVFYCGAMAESVAAGIRGFPAGWVTLALQLLPGMWKGLNRARLARTALPDYRDWFRRHLWVHALWVPLGTWMWLAALLSSCFGNTIQWRGYTHKLASR